MKRYIWKLVLAFIIVIAVIEIRFTPSACADGPSGEDMIPEHYALFWIGICLANLLVYKWIVGRSIFLSYSFLRVALKKSC